MSSTVYNSNLIELRVMNPKPERRSAEATDAKVSIKKNAMAQPAGKTKAIKSPEKTDVYSNPNVRFGPM